MGAEPWRAKLEEGDPDGAWDLFIERYRPLILATIRRTIRERDDVLDVFSHACHQLLADDLARLRRFRVDPDRRAEFSTWLVAVVHNLTIDWVRHRNGRPRLKAPAALSPLQRRLFAHVFVARRSHLEAFELERDAGDDSGGGGLGFAAFLRELAETYRVVERSHPRGAMRYLAGPPPDESDATGLDHGLDVAALRPLLARALDSLGAEERLAVQLHVIEEMPAAEIARVLGWPNAKAVYNRVYRGLARLRATLVEHGVGPDTL